MTPLPKRKHSTARKGRRITSKAIKQLELVKCTHCGQPKRSHYVCKKCGR